MANNSTLNVVDLDRAQLRADLKNFLRNQNAFRDYDFDGSNLSVLIDLLAYNTNKNAFLVNMLFSEAFLDSAQLKSSVFSHAKELNYLPRSARSASANVVVTFTATGENQPYVIPKGATFSTLIKSSQYVFSVPETLIVSSSNTTFSFETQIFEGEYFKDGYVYVSSPDTPYPSFPITNPNVDTSSIAVVVFEDDQVQGTPFTFTSSLLGLSNESKVFFLQATESGTYEIAFGDGVIGYKPAEGSEIIIDYRVTVAEKANSANRFAINFDPTGVYKESTTIKVETVNPSTGGAPSETLDSVRYYAPKWYQTQERATASTDYETLMKVNFPEIQAVAAYGGEDAVPPLFGRVIVSIALPGISTIPSSRKEQYTKFLQGRMPIGLKPVFIDPDYTYVEIRTDVRYDVSVTTATPDRIAALVTSSIQSWDQATLEKFNAVLRLSKLTTQIDKSDLSVLSNSTQVRYYKKMVPATKTPQNFVLDFAFPLIQDEPVQTYPHFSEDESVVSSSPFVFNGSFAHLEDDGNGNLNVVTDVNNQTSLLEKCGTIDYKTGVVTITNLIFDSFDGATFRVFVRSQDADVSAMKNIILTLEPASIIVTPDPVNR